MSRAPPRRRLRSYGRSMECLAMDQRTVLIGILISIIAATLVILAAAII